MGYMPKPLVPKFRLDLCARSKDIAEKKITGNRITPVGDLLALLCDSARLKSTEL